MSISISESTRLWQKILKKLEEKINEKKTYDSFFSNSYLYDVNGNVLIVIAPSKVSKALMLGQYNELISDVIFDVSGEQYSLKVLTEEEIDQETVEKVVHKETKKETNSPYFVNAKVNPNYTFNNFVVGEFNKEAHQAALYVANNGGNLFNPLFMHSHSGLGKTHLLHAIGNEILASRMPGAKILYITANDFVEEYIRFVRAEKENHSLKEFFKDVDVLLLDDVQFLADKVKTEEMFFYIFQDMINAQKRIIITCDRQPSELRGLEDRLVSRFSQGLTVSIGEPDAETCVEILKTKITAAGLDINNIDPSVLKLFAERYSKNVRELEGSINRLILHSLNPENGNKITLDDAIKAAGELRGGKVLEDQLNEQKIINTVCDYYGISVTQITSKTRTGQLALARHLAMWLIRYNLDIPLKKIGDMFGGKDHTTVMSAITKVDNELKTNEQLQAAVKELTERIKQ